MHFSDELKYNLFGSDGRRFVRRRPGERLAVNCVKSSIKFGGGSVMVWGSMSAEGTGQLVRLQGKVNAQLYKDFHQAA